MKQGTHFRFFLQIFCNIGGKMVAILNQLLSVLYFAGIVIFLILLVLFFIKFTFFEGIKLKSTKRNYVKSKIMVTTWKIQNTITAKPNFQDSLANICCSVSDLEKPIFKVGNSYLLTVWKLQIFTLMIHDVSTKIL